MARPTATGVETDVTLAIPLTVEEDNNRQALARVIADALATEGISSVLEAPPRSSEEKDAAWLLLCTASSSALDSEGEHLRYLKRTTKEGGDGERLEFELVDAERFDGHGSSGFWSGAEKGELSLSIMERVVVNPSKLRPLLPPTLSEHRRQALLHLPSLLHILVHAGLVEKPFPLHNQKRRRDLWAKCCWVEIPGQRRRLQQLPKSKIRTSNN